jgi:drug/metabolite transporter (DMT)-like permease
MMWQIFLGISLLFSSLVVIFQKKIHNLSESNPIRFVVAFQILSGIFVLIFGYFSNQLQFQNISHVWVNILFTTLLYGFGNVLYFSGLKQTEASIYTVICGSSSIWAIVGSSIFFHQFLNIKQLLGILLILFSILLVNRVKSGIHLTKGVLMTLLGAVAIGLAMVNDKYVLGYLNMYSYLSIALISPAIFTAVIFWKQMSGIHFYFQKNIVVRFVFVCLLFAIQVVAFFNALFLSTNASQFAGMSMFGSVLTMIMSMIFLNERDRKIIKFMALGLGILGLTLIK